MTSDDSGQQRHLPAVVHLGTQLAKRLRDRLRQRHASGQQLSGSPAGRPPVLLHAIDNDAVEIRDQHWDLKKLGR